MDDLLTKRPIPHAEARDAASRLINSHFRQEPHARASIPARVDYDDDLILMAYIEQQESKSDLEALRERCAKMADDRATSYNTGTDVWLCEKINAGVRKELHVAVARIRALPLTTHTEEGTR